ncbi:MAG: glycosyltransferase [Candidatus Portnoybacteria bacterium]|nr:glycosyltransferase [Candidatus Portnoybacteria bacterium]
MKVALVHDYLLRMGGAERVLLELAKIFPEAPIYVLLCDQEKVAPWFPEERIRPSFLQKFPEFIKRRHKYLLPILPVAAENFDLRDFDLVISSSSAFAKSVIIRPSASHVCYCHSPSRFLWDWHHEYLEENNFNFFKKILARVASNYLRIWDRSSAKRVDYFIANSKATRDKISKYYRQEARVIYPPVALPSWNKFSLARNKGFYLIISQLTPYKKIDVAITAFNKLKLPLIILGQGPEFSRLSKMAGSNIRIQGWASDAERNEFLRDCAAFILPGEDDFGIAAVEAMGWGKPVLAVRAGGAKETVLEGITGEFFDVASPEILADGLRRMREKINQYSPVVIRKWAEKFSQERFRNEMMDFVKKIGYN